MGAQGAKNVDSGNEWATPEAVVRHAADLLGIAGFDLDPAATQGNAKAPSFFDREADGTVRDWYGYVWLNPPFSRSLKSCLKQFGSLDKCNRKVCRNRGYHLMKDQHGAQDFAAKAVKELESGRVSAVAWHGPVAPDTEWFGALWPFVEQRIDYGERICYNGAPSGGTFPSTTLIIKPTRNNGVVPTRRVAMQSILDDEGRSG